VKGKDKHAAVISRYYKASMDYRHSIVCHRHVLEIRGLKLCPDTGDLCEIKVL